MQQYTGEVSAGRGQAEGLRSRVVAASLRSEKYDHLVKESANPRMDKYKGKESWVHSRNMKNYWSLLSEG